MKITFLGTSGGAPTSLRGLSAVAVERGSEIIMFDCGEGTQRQMAKAGLNLNKIEKILISHVHGDHILGLPGILQTLSLLNRERELLIYGAEGIIEFVKAVRRTIWFNPTFPIFVEQVKEGLVRKEKDYSIHSSRTDHVLPGFGYALAERVRPGKFNPKRARELGVPEGPLWSKLQRGEDVTLSNGKIIISKEIVGPSRPGRKIVYTGDTRPSQSIVQLAKNADLLIHDSNYDEDNVEMAEKKGHSTASQAAQIAVEADVKKLVLTHFSPRYESTDLMLKHATTVFQNTIVAEDLLSIEIPFQKSDSV